MMLDFVPIVVVLVGSLGAYLGASRKLSGKIDTSDATSLWQESASIREDYRSRLIAAETRQAHLEERVAKLEGLNNKLVSDNLTLQRVNFELQSRIGSLERENLSLQKGLNGDYD